MLLLGHIGITAGVVKVLDILLTTTETGNSHPPDAGLKTDRMIAGKQWRIYRWLNAIKERVGEIDYRIVVLGALLPDIIDKPVWLLVTRFSNDTTLSGRDYAHSLLFNLILLIAGLVLFRYGKSWWLIISLSSLGHLIFDQIWNSPETLLWPLLGPLPRGMSADWMPNMIEALFVYPEVYIPEIIGLVIVLLFFYRMVISRSTIAFFRDGVVA